MEHVDLVKNEWLAGFQHVVARVYLSGGLTLDSSEQEKWEHLLHAPRLNPASGESVDPEREPDLFFERLHQLLAGDFLFATEVHDEGECPYQDRLVVPLAPPDAAREAQLA
jgi:hypothetical protein